MIPFSEAQPFSLLHPDQNLCDAVHGYARKGFFLLIFSRELFKDPFAIGGAITDERFLMLFWRGLQPFDRRSQMTRRLFL